MLLANTAGASELYGPEAGVVPYGMGRAYSAIADDALALHYNPAGLAMVRKVDFQLFDLRVGTNRDVIQSYKQLGDLGKSSGGSVADTLGRYNGKHIQGAAGNSTQLTIPNFALGFTYDAHTDFNMENQVYPVTRMRYTRDLAFHLGAAVSAGKRRDFRMGSSVRYVRRTGGVRDVRISDISGNRNAVTDQFGATGAGIGGTFGLQYRLPTQGRTEFTTSFVWHDIGHTSFGGSHQQNGPTRIEQNIVAGAGIRIPIGGKKNRRLERRYGPTRSSSHLSFAFDYSHLNRNWDEEHFPKHSHLGMNLDLPILSIQVGLNQTSLTLGTSFDIGIVRVSVATYGEEVGSYGGQKVDRRYLLSIGTGVGFGGF